MRTRRLTTVITVLLAAIIAPVEPADAARVGQSQAARLLDQYRPVLRYDSRETYFAQPVADPPSAPRVVAGDQVYGHVARENEDIWLQYWLFFAYNPQDRGIVRTGRHEGDWEVAQFRLGDDGVPELATLGGHTSAEGCRYDELEHAATDAGTAPVLYVANASHAIYSRAGVHDRPFPDPNDDADGKGRRVRPPVAVVTDTGPDWVKYEGSWGGSRAGFVPGEQSSPPGPRYQESRAWQAPSSFHTDRGRECGSDPPDRPWQTPAAVAVVIALLGLGTMARRRWPRRRAH